MLRDEFTIFDFDQQSESWFKIRLGKFTASDAQAISANGKGLETLVYEKAAEILTGKGKEPFSNPDTERGNTLEEQARSWYEIETGKMVKKIGFCMINEYVGCSPDGLVVSEDGLIEIKCLNDANFVRFLHNKKIESKHVWQMQFQMFVTDKKWVDYCVYNPNFPNRFITQRVNRDEAAIAKITQGLLEGIEQLKEIIGKVK